MQSQVDIGFVYVSGLIAIRVVMRPVLRGAKKGLCILKPLEVCSVEI